MTDDVSSPIDFRLASDAREWEATAMPRLPRPLKHALYEASNLKPPRASGQP